VPKLSVYPACLLAGEAFKVKYFYKILICSFSCSPKKTNQKKGGRSFFKQLKNLRLAWAPAELGLRPQTASALIPSKSIFKPKNDMAFLKM